MNYIILKPSPQAANDDLPQGPVVLVFYDAEGWETDAFDYENIEAAGQAVIEAFEYAREHKLPWYGTEIVPLEVYEALTSGE